MLQFYQYLYSTVYDFTDYIITDSVAVPTLATNYRMHSKSTKQVKSPENSSILSV